MLRLPAAATGKAGSQKDRIDRAGTSAADGIDPDVFLIQQAVENALGERPERPTSV